MWEYWFILQSFLDIYKGVPQGSVLGPILFNILVNDILDFVSKSELYNYTYDNTLSYSSSDLQNVVNALEQESSILIKWFSNNHIKTNFKLLQLAVRLRNKTFLLI